MDFQRYPNLTKRSQQIHGDKMVATYRSLTIQYPADDSLESAIRLARQRFRKPVMMAAQTWLERLIVQDEDAYLCLRSSSS